MPPSIEVLRKRLVGRGSESEESLQKRLGKATAEIARNQDFDKVVLNDNFQLACEEVKQLITKFISS